MKIEIDELLKFTTETSSGCLEWQRCFNTDGYPRATIKTSTNLKVHREIFNLVNGYYPPVVRHKCDNIKCINPNHLEGGTAEDNEKDRRERGRIPNQILEDIKKSVLDLKQIGFSYKEISEKLNLRYKQVDYILYKYGVEKG